VAFEIFPYTKEFTMNRRDALKLGIGGLVLGFEACGTGSESSNSTVQQAVQAAPVPRLRVDFKGLCAYIERKNKQGLDVAFVNAEKNPAIGLHRHIPTLRINRANIVEGEAETGDDKYAYWSLRNRIARLVLGQEETKGRPFGINRGATNCPTGSNAKDWNNFDWVVDVAAVHSGATLRSDWNDPSQALITGSFELLAGTVEHGDLQDAITSKDLITWEFRPAANTRRQLTKDNVRALIDGPSGVVSLRLDPFGSNQPSQTIKVKVPQAPAEPTILVTNLTTIKPAPMQEKIPDFGAYYELVRNPPAVNQRPIPFDGRPCEDLKRTESCSCCPSARFLAS